MHIATSVLRWSNISKSFGRQSLFQQLSGELPAGKTTVVVGPNGSGKSTFLKIAAGLASVDAGDVVRPEATRIGYCAPSLDLYGELTGRENLEFFAAFSTTQLKQCDKLLRDVGLSSASDKVYGCYSSGMKQRLKLAFAALGSPTLLILDEPTLALDGDGVALVDRMIAQQTASGGSVLVATNDRGEAARWANNLLDLSP